LVGIATLTSRIHAAMLWDKYLKKWYLLPLKGLERTRTQDRLQMHAHASRVSLLTQIANLRGKIATPVLLEGDARPGCTRNARNAERAYETAPPVKWVIARLTR
jgi:hypothetical protein